jgi:GNAT superfamily N-acetyltransferase
MAAIEGLPLVFLEPRHIDGACALVAEAGWNQTRDDWRMMLSAGDAIGLEDEAGRLVASALVLPFGSAFGWISMVLVTADWRRKGLATFLLNACIERHEAAGRIAVLDATPEGEVVYARLGFKGVLTSRRWQRGADERRSVSDERVRSVGPADADRIAAYDRGIFGGDRAVVLKNLITRGGAAAWIARDGAGFLLSREGRLARQLGPLCAEDADTACVLLQAALSDLDEPVFIDVPDRHAAVVALLEESGFVVQRPFRRMLRGESDGFGDPSRMFALAGPELG